MRYILVPFLLKSSTAEIAAVWLGILIEMKTEKIMKVMNYGLESVCMLCLTVLRRHVYGWLLRGKVLSNEFGDWAIVYTCTRATQNLVHHYTRGSLHVSWTNNNSHKANVPCLVK